MIKRKKGNNTIIYILLIAAAIMLAVFIGTPETPETRKYSEIIGHFSDNNIKYFTLDLGTGELTYSLKDDPAIDVVTPSESADDTTSGEDDSGVSSGSSSSVAEGSATSGDESQSDTSTPSIGEDLSIFGTTDTGDSSSDAQQIGELPSFFSLFGEPQEQTIGEYTYRVPNVGLFVEDVTGYVAASMEGEEPMEYYDYLPQAETPWWFSVIPTVLLLVGFGVLWYVMFYSQSRGGGAMMVGKAKVKNQAEEGRKTTFDDVAGAKEEKEELVEIVEFLKNPSKYNTLGARIPRGVLFVGPPGTGKTLLARACAGEAGVPFFSISGSDFVEMYVGVGASRVRDLFDKAKKSSPAIVFIDEIDAVGRQRGAGLGGGHDEREQTLNQLLVEMDGFGVNDGVIIIAATNRADILDKALLRPGRFDRQVYVGLPDIKGREEILVVHTKNKPLAPDVELKTIAKGTPGFTGADLENLVNEAALLAARHGRKAITMYDIEESTIKVVAGPEKKSRIMSEKERKLTAYHEAGHAIATIMLPNTHPVHTISIIPRGMAGGFTMSLPEEDTNYRTKNQMLDEMTTLLGGRVAEKLVLDDISTGASNDLERATSIARNMVTRYGFSDKLGPVVYGENQAETFLGRDFNSHKSYSDTVALEIDTEMRALLDNAYKQAVDILTENMEKLHKVSAELLIREKLDGEEFKKLMDGEELPEFEPRAEKQPIDLKALNTPVVDISAQGIAEAQKHIDATLQERRAESEQADEAQQQDEAPATQEEPTTQTEQA